MKEVPTYITQIAVHEALFSLEAVSGPDSNLLQYNSSSGEMKVTLSSITDEFTAGTGLSYSNGEYALDADTDDVAEGSSNLYFTQARARGALSGGTGISYNNGTGAIAISLARADGIGVSGNTISFTGDSDDVSEGSSNLYFSQARARASVQADSAAGNLLSYSNSSGDLLVSTDSVRGAFSGGTALLESQVERLLSMVPLLTYPKVQTSTSHKRAHVVQYLLKV